MKQQITITTGDEHGHISSTSRTETSEPYGVSIDFEIVERAITKERPEPTYGTKTNVSFVIDRIPDDLKQITETVRSLSEAIEIGLQVEIERRKQTKEQ